MKGRLHSVSRTVYSVLFGAIGTQYGAGDGSTTFNVPDVRGRLPVGLNSGGPALINGLGKNDGRAVAVRNISHHHTWNVGNVGGTPANCADWDNNIQVALNTSGDSNNTDYPAFLVINYIIKT